MASNPLNIGVCDYCGAQTVDGYCVNVMDTRFHAVADPDDWKAPIDHIIPFEALRETVAAIAFYTATEATWEDVQPARGVRMVRVKADGYRAGPAGP